MNAPEPSLFIKFTIQMKPLSFFISRTVNLPPASLVRAAQRQIISMFAPNYCALQMEGKKKKKKKRDEGKIPFIVSKKARKDLHRVVHFAQHCNKQWEAECSRHEEARGWDCWQGVGQRYARAVFLQAQKKKTHSHFHIFRNETSKMRKRWAGWLSKKDWYSGYSSEIHTSTCGLTFQQHHLLCFPLNKYTSDKNILPL